MRTPYWTKKGHLGMTRAELKAALEALPTPEVGDAGKAVVVNEDADGYELGEAGGGGGYNPNEPHKLMIVLTPAEFMSVLSGTSVSKQATFYDKTKFQPYMTVAVSTEPVTETILYATSYDDDVNAASKTFITGSYVDQADKIYIVSAIRTDANTGTFTIKAAEL